MHRGSRLWTRRQLVHAGGTGLFGLSLPRLLAADAARRASARALQAPAGQRAAAKSCIFIVTSGGLSHIDTIDPRPGAPAEIRGPYAPIATRVPGVHVTEMLPRLALLADRYTLVRSLSHGDTVHVTAAHTMLSGQPDGTPQNNSPFIGSLVARFRPSTANVPSHVWLHNMKTGTNKVPRYESGLNVLGHAYAPLRVGEELDNPADQPDFRVTDFDPPGGLTTGHVTERFRLLEQLDRPLAAAEAAPDERFRGFQQKARELVTGAAARAAFDLSGEPDDVRDRYGRHPLGQYCIMARRLVEAGVRIVTVTAWPGLAPGETKPTVTQVWDMHDTCYGPGESMFGNGPFGMQWSLPRLDQAVSALLADLDERGLLDETLVVLVGEFGRTPKFESLGRGRGHWPQAYSALLAGGGVRRGAVYGESDRQGAFVASGRPIDHADFGATLFHALGIPPELRWGPDGFSFRVSDGRPVEELFG
ncbi:MAG TPA: DUF1501 domain-containing protein [Planctomycetaceae bacterium]|nr:DUF1501 domain-containing protein [Planctomycetaceae bacterium]